MYMSIHQTLALTIIYDLVMLFVLAGQDICGPRVFNLGSQGIQNEDNYDLY